MGWNFAFVGASTLLTETCRPSERAKVQGANDFLVFGSVVSASLSSGALLHFLGWDAVQVFALPFVALATAAVLWLMWLRPPRSDFRGFGGRARNGVQSCLSGFRALGGVRTLGNPLKPHPFFGFSPIPGLAGSTSGGNKVFGGGA